MSSSSTLLSLVYVLALMLSIVPPASCHYLDPPFLTFHGTFFTNTGTLNNFVNNYNPANKIIPWWNPKGVNYFYFKTVETSAVLNQSWQWEDSSTDCAVGGEVTTNQYAKLVDLDPDDQFVSQIYGMSVTLTTANGKGTVSGNFKPTELRDQWLEAQCNLPDFKPAFGQTTRQRAGIWLTILTQVKFEGDFSCSPSLQYLQQVSQKNENTLSFKINCDNFNNDLTSDEFGIGRVRGVLGPHFINEPISFLGDRLLSSAKASVPIKPTTCSVADPVPFSNAPVHIIQQSAQSSTDVEGLGGDTLLIFDLANGLPLDKPAGTPLIDTFRVQFLSFQTSHQDEDNEDSDYDNINHLITSCVLNMTDDVHSTRAGLVSCQLSDVFIISQQQKQGNPDNTDSSGENTKIGSRLHKDVIDNMRISLVDENSGIEVLAETANGLYIFAEPRTRRLEYGQDATVKLYATRLGKPLSEYNISLVLTHSPMRPRPDRVNNVPISGISFPKLVKFEQDGTAQITIKAGNVSNGLPDVRSYVGSQLYIINTVQDTRMPHLDFRVSVPPSNIPDHPTWQDVLPILNRYSHLFPGMNSFFNLTDETIVKQNAGGIIWTLQADFEDPSYMPVTRDISVTETNLLVKYLSLNTDYKPEITQQGGRVSVSGICPRPH